MKSVSPVKVGIIGCGAISGAYFGQMRKFPILQTVACADLLPARAAARAQEFDVPRACTPAELLADPEIEIVVNLTIPVAHYQVALAALEAGKSVWNEKPLALNRDQARPLLAAAQERGLLVGCAPDTFLGGGYQTCIKLIRDGAIGEPVGTSSFMMSHGHESWHPDPEFYYQPGGGPMFDMGPYYLTALVAMLGPVRRLAGLTRTTFPERLITSQPKHGQRIVVEVPTHVLGLLEFANDAQGSIATTFDVWASELHNTEVYGTEGTLWAPDPNGPGGPVFLQRAGEKERREIPLTHGYAGSSRSLGVADMAYALRYGRPFRPSGELAFHVLDIMQSLHESSDQGRYVVLESTCSQPAPLPLGIAEGELDE